MKHVQPTADLCPEFDVGRIIAETSSLVRSVKQACGLGLDISWRSRDPLGSVPAGFLVAW